MVKQLRLAGTVIPEGMGRVVVAGTILPAFWTWDGLPDRVRARITADPDIIVEDRRDTRPEE